VRTEDSSDSESDYGEGDETDENEGRNTKMAGERSAEETDDQEQEHTDVEPASPTSPIDAPEYTEDFTRDSRSQDAFSRRISSGSEAIDVEPATTSSEVSLPIKGASPLPPTPVQRQLSTESNDSQLFPTALSVASPVQADMLSPRVDSTDFEDGTSKKNGEALAPSIGFMGWEKVKKAFIRSASRNGQRSRTNSVRERSSSVSRESRGSLPVSLSGSSKGKSNCPSPNLAHSHLLSKMLSRRSSQVLRQEVLRQRHRRRQRLC
jgi:hypothetical protein